MSSIPAALAKEVRDLPLKETPSRSGSRAMLCACSAWTAPRRLPLLCQARSVAFSTVLLDWRGTLAVTMTERQWVGAALERCARPAHANAVTDVVRRLDGPQSARRLSSPDIDCSAAAHRQAYEQVFADAGLDRELSTALYAVESDPALNPFAADVAGTVAALRVHGVAVGIISDIHVDLRPAFRGAGITVDAFALSYEHGMAKPNPAFFALALAQLAATVDQTLMVGDRSGWDGAAVEAGLTTLLLPPLRSVEDRRLHHVLALTAMSGSCPEAAPGVRGGF